MVNIYTTTVIITFVSGLNVDTSTPFYQNWMDPEDRKFVRTLLDLTTLMINCHVYTILSNGGGIHILPKLTWNIHQDRPLSVS